MDTADERSLSPDARDERLGDGGVGVLSFAEEGSGPPHAIPVSYGYTAESSTFFFRLAAGEKRRKGEVEGRAVTFVTYGAEDDGRWWSVVASGTLESTTDEAIATEALAGLDAVHIPLVDMFEVPTGEVTFSFVRLVPDELSARAASPRSQ